MPVRPSTTSLPTGRPSGPRDLTDLRPESVAAIVRSLESSGTVTVTDVRSVERSWTTPSLVGGAVNGSAMTSTSTVTVALSHPVVSGLPVALGAHPAVLRAVRDAAAQDHGLDLATTDSDRTASTTVVAAAGRTTMMFAELPLLTVTADLVVSDGPSAWYLPDVTLTAMDLGRDIAFSTTEHQSGLGSARLCA